jgi:tetratricopeptide (TPR) repeat protein
MTTDGIDPSQTPLTDEIKHADNPALAASLRATEQARQELADGQVDEALRSLGPAVSIDPSNPFAYFYLGRVYAERRDFTQALTFFKRAEINFGGNPQWLGATIGNEGTCYEEMNQMSDAADAYRRALAAAPDNLMARAGYGRLGEEFPASSSAADPATPPEAVGDNPPNDLAAAPPPEEAQPPPPPDASPAEELPASVKPAPDAPN